MKTTILNNVSPLDNPEILSEGPFGRRGTAVAPETAMLAILGPAARETDPEAKVKTWWFLYTPRGRVCVRDYWWNHPSEWTLAGPPKACLWAAAYFRSHGFQAACGKRGYDLEQSFHVGLVKAA